MSCSKIDEGTFELPTMGEYRGPLQKFIDKMAAQKKIRLGLGKVKKKEK